jgi:hypothetical protein
MADALRMVGLQDFKNLLIEQLDSGYLRGLVALDLSQPEPVVGCGNALARETFK